MGTCIYCGRVGDDSSEHVLQNSLGAHWETKSILCKECNELFGNTIDKSLAEEFAFFMNFLSIKGKRGGIPSVEMTTPEGDVVTRNGNTGSITTQGNVRVKKEKINDNSYCVSVRCDVANSGKIFDDIRKGAEKRGFKISEIITQDYDAEPMGMLHRGLSFSTSTYVALRKSVVNYWCSQRRDQDIDNIQVEAKKIYSFAKFCKENSSCEARVAYAKELGIDGFPLTIELSEAVKELISRSAGLFHSIFLVEHDGTLFGGVYLFNNIGWGFKLHDTAQTTMPITIAIFDILNKNVIKSLENINNISSHEFQFTQYPHKEMLKKFEAQFSEAVALCAAVEHHTSVKSILEPGELELAFPIKDINVIKKILNERGRIILGWEFAERGIPPSFFEGDAGTVFPQIIVDSFLKKEGPDFTLTHNTYDRFIQGTFHIAKHMAEKIPAAALIPR